MAKGSPGPLPTRAAYSTRTAEEVVRNLPSDDFYRRVTAASGVGGALGDPRMAAAVLGAPVLVRALIPGQQDGWLVPLVSGGVPIAVISVSIRPDGTGHATSMRGWPYASVPALPEALARTLAAVPGDDVASLSLVWIDGLDRPSDILSPVWDVKRVSGAEVFLFENRILLPSAAVRR